MNRTTQMTYIRQKLAELSVYIEMGGKLNLLDGHVHAEEIYRRLVNSVFGWNLVNLNAAHQNQKGTDLIDENAKIIAQVSGTVSKRKIEETLSKTTEFAGYTLKMIFLVSGASRLRSQNYPPSEADFFPEEDIIDAETILRKLQTADVGAQQQVANLLRTELGSDDGETTTDLGKMAKDILAIFTQKKCHKARWHDITEELQGVLIYTPDGENSQGEGIGFEEESKFLSEDLEELVIRGYLRSRSNGSDTLFFQLTRLGAEISKDLAEAGYGLQEEQ